ncbi:MAG TPA: hypothetical protein VM432_07475 [Bdellovibrionales bacterium]|jgi:hypothetical protein|nr:hypothetical protein [Bdellovibrionales bacterium]
MIKAVALTFFIASHALAANTPEEVKCTKEPKTLKEVAGRDVHERWIETTMDDGKPLKIVITSKDDQLYFIFDKSKEGIWAEGRAEVCKEKKDLVLRVSGKDIKLGKEAPFPIRISMGRGAKFKLRFDSNEKLHVSTFGWSGDFVPDQPKP